GRFIVGASATNRQACPESSTPPAGAAVRVVLSRHALSDTAGQDQAPPAEGASFGDLRRHAVRQPLERDPHDETAELGLQEPGLRRESAEGGTLAAVRALPTKARLLNTQCGGVDGKSTRRNSSHADISYAVLYCSIKTVTFGN